jgi:5-methylcytosine-specific restriction endonuclease McrA
MDPEELHARQHVARELRHWRDDLGMVRLGGALPPQVGIPIVTRLEAETDRIRKRARWEQSDEPRAAHAADALVRLMGGQGRGRRDRADLVVVWDRSKAGEDNGGTAHIVGGGPIPVAEARRLAERAFVKALIHDGVRIQTIKHVGRSIPTELRTALELGDPPGFDGFACVDCGSRHGVQRDHVDPVANGGLTSYDNLAGRCWECHEKKTEADRRAGLLVGRGKANGRGSGGGREPP